MGKYLAAGAFLAIAAVLLWVALAGRNGGTDSCPKNGDYWQAVSLECLGEYPGFNASNLSFTILYEDSDILVLSKAPNQAVHPSEMGENGTLLNEVASYLRHSGGGQIIGLPSRIDKDTSGILVLGKTTRAFAQLKQDVIGHDISSYYYALVGGILENTTYIDYPIGPDYGLRKSLNASGISGHEYAMKAYGKNENGADGEIMPAFTYLYPLRRCNGSTFVRATILTGRTHQIRVHAKAIGHPIIGDALYGGDLSAIRRQFLHRAHVEFVHPVSGASMSFDSPLPEDLRAAYRAYCGRDFAS